MVIDNKFEIGQIVYLKTDKEQLPRMITGLSCRGGEGISYWLGCGDKETNHFDIEISAEKNVEILTEN